MISQKVLKMCISSKNKQLSKYQAEDIKIFLRGVTMVLAKTISNRPMAKGDPGMLILLRWQFTIEENFIECLERLSSRS